MRAIELLAEGISRDLTDPSSWLLTTIDATTIRHTGPSTARNSSSNA